MTMLLRSLWSKYRPRVLYTLNPSGFALLRAACSRSRRVGSPTSLGKKLPAMVSHIGTGAGHLEDPLQGLGAVTQESWSEREKASTQTTKRAWLQGWCPTCSELANLCFDMQ
jgi:hypothetical protein